MAAAEGRCDPAGPGPGSKRTLDSNSNSGGDERDRELRRFFRAWAWKREHRPDRDRFHRPYKHTLVLPAAAESRKQQQKAQAQQQPNEQGQAGSCTLVIKQSKFNAEGFASTVWDSSIVVAKWCEHWADAVAGARCLDLSSGCGLVAIVLARLGADVVATDLAPNLPLLRENCQANAPGAVAVLEHTWGTDVAPLGPPFDLVFACDVMYVEEAVPDLVATLRALCSGSGGGGGGASGSGGGAGADGGGGGARQGTRGAPAPAARAPPSTRVIVAHGRNRGAEGAFLRACEGAFAVARLPEARLHPDYACSDVDVLELTPLTAAG
ncbi:hypothetical protein Rsub_00814 [Raphidocelis subcapitata]|uniref:Uncharacterized protein n=1 Tax=Raphidocelis subcapitata TaxID=307507 RepID=A0A2V0NNM7_9CHLO|nr:hypothetical protein Rsub_00814 [Raphidocelis subcapitata]|eukprot:GBF88102.1 hypothetical protein Rsub_00814 [Raphidocelis subcapitata]